MAVFANIRDHLDFHPTIEGYYLAKRRLFEGAPGVALVNLDDRYGARPACELKHEPLTFALERPVTHQATDVQTGLDGSRFTIHGPHGETEIVSPLRGRFNVYDVLGAYAAARALGLEPEPAAEAIGGAGLVPGRFQPAVSRASPRTWRSTHGRCWRCAVASTRSTRSTRVSRSSGPTPTWTATGSSPARRRWRMGSSTR